MKIQETRVPFYYRKWKVCLLCLVNGPEEKDIDKWLIENLTYGTYRFVYSDRYNYLKKKDYNDDFIASKERADKRAETNIKIARIWFKDVEDAMGFKLKWL